MTETLVSTNAFLNQPFSLRPYGERMIQYALSHRLPLDRDVSRSELIGMGYFMFNQMGEGERVIVQECNGEDWRNKPLLTWEEYQRSRAETLPKELTPQTLPEIEADMEDFIDEVHTALMINESLGDGYLFYFHNQLLHLSRRFSFNFTSLDQDSIIDAIQNTIQTLMTSNQVPAHVRGIPIEQLSGRTDQKIRNHRCPILNCGHVFSNPGGILIHGSIGNGTYRLNSGVAHLAGHHGISETGDANPDQRYISISEYLPLFHKRAEAKYLHELNARGISLAVIVGSTRLLLSQLETNDFPEQALVQYIKESILFMRS